MPVLELYQLMSETLLKKLDQDNEDLANKRRPCTLPEFLFETPLRLKSDCSLDPDANQPGSSNITLAVLYARQCTVPPQSRTAGRPSAGHPLQQAVHSPREEVHQRSGRAEGEAQVRGCAGQLYDEVGPAAVYQKALLMHTLPQTGVSLQYLLALVNWYVGKTCTEVS